MLGYAQIASYGTLEELFNINFHPGLTGYVPLEAFALFIRYCIPMGSEGAQNIFTPDFVFRVDVGKSKPANSTPAP